MANKYQGIYDIVSQIPSGKVATYGQIARLWNKPRHARQIGYALFRVAPEDPVPWHRVVNAQGRISQSPMRMGSDELQRLLLEAEGIIFHDDRIDLKQYLWDS
ncbi:MAG: methyltransferase [Acaryochloridaceae cyanobacterium RL_2_7]|nr:methyltransferase [Acaryochloridaceae cyanobacterium RL_2_7]